MALILRMILNSELLQCGIQDFWENSVFRQ
jgi:hypothetical protein